MAIINADIKLPSVSRTMEVMLYYPTDLPVTVGNEVKGVITLLHGMSNTAADWFYMSAAPRYAADNGYILVAPSVDNSFYHDMEYGTAFYSALTNELPAQLNRIFKIPPEREKNFICGLSMGGYGALRLALSKPEKYSAAASFSGAVDMAAALKLTLETPQSPFHSFFAPVFGNELNLPDNANIFCLAEKAVENKTALPRLLLTCGKQDDGFPMYIRTQNQNLKQHAEKIGMPLTYLEWDGIHEWNFWDRSLCEFIGFIQNSDYADKKINDWTTAKG